MEDDGATLAKDHSHAAQMRRSLLWKITEQKVLGVYFMLRDRLTELDRRNVLGFTDANEFALAFEQLVLAMLEETRPISRYERAVIETLYRHFSGAQMQVGDAEMAKLESLVSD